jgi:two-component system response regulator FlrC
MARVLVVDDEEGIREFIAEVLEDAGHAVTLARDGVEAETLLESRSFDLVISDLKMPRGDGMTVLRKAKSVQSDTEVVMLTAHGSVTGAVEAMKLGAFDYLQKPLSGPQELRLLVSRALERRAMRSTIERVAREATDTPPLSYGAPSMEPVVRALRKVATTDATVLFTGESGTGKEIAARTLHQWSRRVDGPFVAINCAALTETLLESELFGHEKGSFTGATSAQRGRIELADGGTFFLDEVGELKLELQAKLLRVVQERLLERVGGRRSIPVDVRWVAATNRDLLAMVNAGTFREDLYHRLAVFPMAMPPLRDRREDIVPLAEGILARVGASLKRGTLTLDDDARKLLVQNPWRGNIRELANALERAAILADGSVLRGEDFSLPPSTSDGRTSVLSGPVRTLEELEQAAIVEALAGADGNKRRAAERLGVPLRTFYDKLKRFGLS